MSETNGKANGHARNANEKLHIPGGTHLGDNTITDTNRDFPHPLDRVVADYPASGAILQMQTGLFQHGLNRARSSGATKPVPEDQKALEEHARAMARQTYRDSFDPSKHPHDKVRYEEYQHQLAQRDESQQGASHAVAYLRDADTNLAKTPKAGEKPAPNPWLGGLLKLGTLNGWGARYPGKKARSRKKLLRFFYIYNSSEQKEREREVTPALVVSS